MRSILQRSVYPHDLDPSFASASARASNGGKVTITINSDGYLNTNASTALNDPNSIAVSYVGPGAITSLVFNPGGTGATGGNVTGGVNGEFDTNGTATSPTVTYFQTDQPGLVFLPNTKAFTLGNSTGLTAADVTIPTIASGFTNAAGTPTPAATGFYTMTIGFPTQAFTGGKVLRFTVGRGNQRSANTGNGGNVIGTGTTAVSSLADLFGGGVMIPGSYDSASGTYTVITNGMTFSGTTSDGGTFTGVIKNRIGNGYSPVDGFGLINAEAAVKASIQ